MKNKDIEAKKDVGEIKETQKSQRKYEKQPLSGREKGFIKAFTDVGSETYGLAIESALKAGFVEKLIEQTARRLMANPKVLVAIDSVYASKLEATPTNISRVMSNLDHTESIALKVKSMPTLTKIAELRGKYLDIFSANSSAPSERDAALQVRISQEQKKIFMLISSVLLSGDGEGLPEQRSELRQMILNHPELIFPDKVKKAAIQTVDEIGEHVLNAEKQKQVEALAG